MFAQPGDLQRFSTVGLCKGFTFNIENKLVHWDADTQQLAVDKTAIETKLASWLAIVSPPHAFHLKLEGNPVWSDDYEMEEVVGIVMNTVPTPSVLTITDFEITQAIFYLSPARVFERVKSFNCDATVDMQEGELGPLEQCFPNLENLFNRTLTSFAKPFTHHHLKSLTLTSIKSTPADVAARYLAGFPQLRELRMELFNEEDEYTQAAITPTHRITLAALEIFIVKGEGLLMLLDHLNLPSLTFLACSAFGTMKDMKNLDVTIPQFFDRTCLSEEGITVSISGAPSRDLFNVLMRCLPPKTRLHCNLSVSRERLPTSRSVSPMAANLLLSLDNVRDVFCTDLCWLPVHDFSAPNHPIKINVLAREEARKDDRAAAKAEEARARSARLGKLGYEVQLCSEYDMDTAVWRSVSPLYVAWDPCNLNLYFF